jgi:hypothetical protein
LRPALAVRDPAVLFIDWVRHVLGQSAAGTAVRPAGPAIGPRLEVTTLRKLSLRRWRDVSRTLPTERLGRKGPPGRGVGSPPARSAERGKSAGGRGWVARG